MRRFALLTAFAVVIFTNVDAAAAQSVRTAEPKATIPPWEYKTVHSDQEVTDFVNAGWEFVSMASDQQGQHYLLRHHKTNAPTSDVSPVVLYRIEPKYTSDAR